MGLLRILGVCGIAILAAGCGLSRQTVSVKTLYQERHDPLSPVEHVRLGQLYQGQGRWDLAEREFHQALRHQADDPTIWNAIGVLAFQRGQFLQAEEYFRQAYQLSPGNRQALNNLAWTYVQHAEQEPGAVASIVFRWLAREMESMMEQPDLRGHYYWDTLGMLYLRLEDWDRARACFARAWQLASPDEQDFLQEVGQHQALLPSASMVP